MKSWKELNTGDDQSDAEKILIKAVKAMHASDVMSTTSEEAVYNVLAGKAGVRKDKEETPVEEKPKQAKKTTKKKRTKKTD